MKVKGHERLGGIHRFLARQAQRAGIVASVSGPMPCAARRSYVRNFRNIFGFVKRRKTGYVQRRRVLEYMNRRYSQSFECIIDRLFD